MIPASERQTEIYVGMILAGGKARRMGGFAPENASGRGHNKGAITIDGRSMLSLVAERLQPQVHHLLLSGPADVDEMDISFVARVEDIMPDQAGPLAGIAAGLDWTAKTIGPNGILISVTTDVPFIPEGLVQALTAPSIDSKKPAIAVSNGRRHPTIAAWPQACLAPMQQALNAGRLGVDDFAHMHDAIEVPFPISDTGGVVIDPFFNVNTPQDVQKARDWFAARK